MHAPQSAFSLPVSDTRALRSAFSRFATGVTIVTTMTEHGPIGMTANSFSSVSLEPPLSLWSIDRKSSRYSAFADSAMTAIHVLSADQEATCLAFAKRADAFDETDWAMASDGLPHIGGCLARFTCRRYGTHQAGDHTILVDEIIGAQMTDGAPLIFSQGEFGGFIST
ncbi:MAG: flavin reductase family protein [Devosiaceae bacterium]|nr:flavin reductase family protein [Devosiaceae bacterium MH13]